MSETRPHSRLERAQGIHHVIPTGNVKVMVVARAVGRRAWCHTGPYRGSRPSPECPVSTFDGYAQFQAPAYTEVAHWVFLHPWEPYRLLP